MTKRATIALPEEIDKALAADGRDHGLTEPLGSVLDAAPRDFLATRGYPDRSAQIAPVDHEDE